MEAVALRNFNQTRIARTVRPKTASAGNGPVRSAILSAGREVPSPWHIVRALGPCGAVQRRLHVVEREGLALSVHGGAGCCV
jgi:hypothetical protein